MPSGVYDHYKIRKVSKIENWDQYKDLEYYPDRVCKCGCGGRIKVKAYHSWYGIPDYIRGHGNRGKHTNYPDRVPREIRFCECGCGETFECLINSKQRFIHGHNGRCRSKEANKRIAEAHTGKSCPGSSKFMKHFWENVENREKRLEAIFKGLKLSPNKPERF